MKGGGGKRGKNRHNISPAGSGGGCILILIVAMNNQPSYEGGRVAGIRAAL